MIIVLQESVGVFEFSEQVSVVYEVADFGIQGDRIAASLGTAEGQILVYDGTQWVVIDPPSADGQTLVSDLAVAGLWKIGSTGGGGGSIELKNGDATQALTGSVAIADLSQDTAFKSTTVPAHLGAIGVAAEDINSGVTGTVTIAGMNTVLVAGNVARGEWIVTSATAWRGKSAGYDTPLWGAVGYAMTAYAGGGNGSVNAVVYPNPKQLSSAGTAWALGGFIAVATTNAQKFTIASATWAGVAGAALGTATAYPAGLGYGTTAGYAVGGYTTAGVVTAYKMPFATEITATQSSANLPAARCAFRGGYNAADRGYAVGGNTGLLSNVVTKLTYATDTMSAALGTTLAVARNYSVGVSDGANAYAQGGDTGSVTGVSDKIVISSDTVSDNNGGDVTADSYAGFSFAADNGYMAEKTGATNNSKKIAFSTGVSANVTSTLPADQTHAAGVCDGNGLAWLSGDDASPYSVSHKFTKATETYAADAGAVMAVGKYYAAYFNNGAY